MEKFLTELVERSHQALLSDDPDDPFGGYAYLRGRGVTDEQIALFKLGIGPRGKMWAPLELKDTVDGKMFNRQFRGSMEGQITIPIWNPSGKLRGVETRLWEETEDRKYTQYWLEAWREDAVFLGIPAALEAIWETRTVYLVEGMFDFFPVQRVFPNTLCTLTAKVMWSQSRFLQRFCRHVVFLYDMDSKGQEAAAAAMDRANIAGHDGYLAHRLMYPAKDPGELYERWGFSRFERYLRDRSDRLNLYL